jgi:hypothetical protein
MSKRSLTPTQHLALATLLKRIRRDLHSAARLAQVYGRVSQQLYDAAAALPRDWLQEREDVGEAGMVEGVPVRAVYFGREAAE